MVISFIALTILLPLLLLLSLLVWWKLGKPVFFKQERPGLYGKPFTLIKFRTMIDKQNSRGNLLPDEKRLTRSGKWLRSTSLDELPELLNVLRGDMSLVGPRPLLVEYLKLYSPEQARRHEVRPGITGWAQIKGRNDLSWEDRFKLDIWYVDHQSFWLDLKILLLTPFQVIAQQGISQEGHATMESFKGNRE